MQKDRTMNHAQIIDNLPATQEFACTFIKKDGTRRTMLARFNVTKYLLGEGRRYDPANYNLMTVFDMNKSAYRTIPLDRLLWVRTKGKRYYVSP